MSGTKVTEIALKALSAIAHPVQHFQEQANRYGMKLDGAGAIVLTKDPGWLRAQAQEALQQIRELEQSRAQEQPQDRPNPFQERARACVRSGTESEMHVAHADLLRDMLRTRVDVTSVMRSETKASCDVSIGFRNETVKLLVLTTPGPESVTARIMLYQDPEELGLEKHGPESKLLTQALSCQNCRKQRRCTYTRKLKNALEHGMLQSCEDFDVTDDCVEQLTDIVRAWAAREAEHAKPG